MGQLRLKNLLLLKNAILTSRLVKSFHLELTSTPALRAALVAYAEHVIREKLLHSRTFCLGLELFLAVRKTNIPSSGPILRSGN
jgi:hypothetical protein